MGLPIIWQPNAGGSTYPVKTRLKGGITPSAIDIDSIQNYTALNQILAEMNRQAVNAGLAPVPYVVIGHTKVNKALIDTWRATIQAINGRTFAAATYITRTLIRNLRIALRVNTVGQNVNVAGYQMQRNYNADFSTNNNQIFTSFPGDRLVIANNLPSNSPFSNISRYAVQVTVVPNPDHPTDLQSVTISSRNVDGLSPQFTPYSDDTFPLIEIAILNDWPTIDFDMAPLGTILMSGQLSIGTPGTTRLGSYQTALNDIILSPGNYTFCFKLQNDLSLLLANTATQVDILGFYTAISTIQVVMQCQEIYQPDF